MGDQPQDGPPGRPVVWVISGQRWPRAYMRGELLEAGYEAEGMEEIPPPGAAGVGDARAAPAVVIVDLFGLPARSADLRRLARTGAPLLLLGGAMDLDRTAAHAVQPAAVLRRPFTIREVVDAVRRLCPPGPPA